MLRRLSSLWSGPADLSRPLRLEWRIVLGRWLAISFVAAGLAVAGLSPWRMLAAYLVLLAALAYTLVLQRLIRGRAQPVEDGTLPTVGDVVLCALMFPILGGFDNPFYAVLYLVMVSAGIRLGLKRGMLLAASVGLMDAAGLLLSGGEAMSAAIIIRTGVLLGTVFITSYLYEEASRVETELADRLLQSEELNRALEHQTLHDGLTELPNRTFLHEQVQQAIAQHDESDHAASVALLVIDLDRFKEINDTFGHSHGDLLLQQIGARLRTALGSEDVVARLGGDEFAVLIANSDELQSQRIARQLLAVLDEPFSIAGHSLDVGASIGIALSPEHGCNADVLLRRADVAMYLAKQATRGYAVYSFDRDQHSPERLALMSELRKAIEGEELRLAYQPKVSLKSSRCVGVEALVRWHHPQQGIIPPDLFIPLAEQTGLIKSLSYWVLNNALRQASAWHRAGLNVPIAVNLSMRDLHDPELPDTIVSLLKRWQVAPTNLQVEITENGLMAEPARALQTVSALRALGLRIAIDDFGTGYSSFAYLKRLPVDELKIDRSFVREMCEDADDRAIVKSTIGLGHDLGLSIVAEGIEDAATWDLLEQMGCDIGQGYYIGRPVPADELVDRFRPLIAAA